MTREMFAKSCMILQSLPSQVKWDDAVQATYLLGLKGWSDNVAGSVMMYVLNNCEFRPTVAELRKIAIKMFDPMLTPDRIYEEIRKILVFVSPQDRPAKIASMIAQGKMKDEVRRVVEECGGWARLGLMESAEVRKKVAEAVEFVYESTNFEHVFVKPAEGPALEQGRKAVEALVDDTTA